MLRDSGPRHYFYTSHSYRKTLGKPRFDLVNPVKNVNHIKSTLTPLATSKKPLSEENRQHSARSIPRPPALH